MKATYSKKLKDPRWQKKRLLIMKRDKFKCKYCKDDKTTLNVHHLAYTTQDVWEELNENLITLCEPCHKLQHMAVVVDFVHDFSFDDFYNEDSFIKEFRTQLTSDTKEVYMTRSSHSFAIEFFEIIKIINNSIYIKHSGGAS